MNGVSYVSNDKGENTALLIDLVQLRENAPLEDNLLNFFEQLDDLIAIELSKGEKGRPYSEVRKEILNNG